MSMTLGDEAYLPKPFPHAEAQSVVPRDEHFGRSFAFYRKWKANPQHQKERKNNECTKSVQNTNPATVNRIGADRRRVYAYACGRKPRVRF
jgi:hypothetical protein